MAAVLEKVGPAVAAIGRNKYLDKGVEEIGKTVKEELGKKLGGSVEDKVREAGDALKISLRQVASDLFCARSTYLRQQMVDNR